MFAQLNRLMVVLALCSLLVQPAQAEPVDSLAVEAEHQAATQQKTEPKEITIDISGQHKAAAAALLEAVDEGTLVTGIADFDSLSSTYGLTGIHRRGRKSPFFYGNRFRLTFPSDADVADIAGAYWNLSYIQSVEPEPPPEAQARKLVPATQADPMDSSQVENREAVKPPVPLWNRIRSIGGGERATGRIFTKIFVGSASSVVSSGALMLLRPPTSGLAVTVNTYHGTLFGFPLGVSLADPYDSFSHTLLVGYLLGLGVSHVNDIKADTRESHPYVILLSDLGNSIALVSVALVGSLYASEKWRKPPQDTRVSFGLFPTFNGGLSTVAHLRF